LSKQLSNGSGGGGGGGGGGGAVGALHRAVVVLTPQLSRYEIFGLCVQSIGTRD
jgi:hypothetical protein